MTLQENQRPAENFPVGFERQVLFCDCRKGKPCGFITEQVIFTDRIIPDTH
jgi:hypothetical protein